MERDARAPAIVCRPEPDDRHQSYECQAKLTVRTADAEIDQRDDPGKWEPIADDGKGPGITGIADVDQAAD